MIIELTNIIHDNWCVWRIDNKQPDNLSFIKLNGRDSVFGAISILVLSGNKKPKFYIKIARNIKSSEIIIHEFNILSQVKDIMLSKNQLFETIPQVLDIAVIGERKFMIERAIIGKAFNNCRNVNEIKKNLQLDIISDWIVNFNLITKKLNVESNSLIEEYLDKNIHEIRANKLLNINRYTIIKESLYKLKSNITNYIRKHKIPIVYEHGDFSPTNIIFTKNNISVIDWEDSIINGLPGIDLWHFIISYNSHLYKSGVYKNKLPDTILYCKQNNEWIEDILNYYCSKMELTREYLWYCLPISIIRAINRDSSVHKDLDYSSINWMDRLLQYMTQIAKY